MCALVHVLTYVAFMHICMLHVYAYYTKKVLYHYLELQVTPLACKVDRQSPVLVSPL